MGIQVKITGKFPDLQLDREATAQVGKRAEEIVVARAFDRGLDTRDLPFERYSPGYAEEAGPKVDLTRTGRLRRGVKVRVIQPGTCELTVEGPAAAYAGDVQKERRFLGFSPSDKDAIGEELREGLADTLKRQRSGGGR